MKTIIAFLCLGLSVPTFAYDLAQKMGIGVTGGFPIPVFGNSFNTIHKEKWNASAYARYHLTSAFGLDLGVSRDEFLGSSLKFDNINLLGFFRTAGTADFTPVVGAGVAFTRIKNFSPSNMKLSLLARLGMEYGLSEAFSIAGLVDYKYVSKIMGNMPGSRVHVVSPQLALTWYFGGSEKAKSEESSDVPPVVQAPAPQVEEVAQNAPLQAEGLNIQQVDGRDEIAIEVEFDTGKAEVASDYDSHLKDVANFLKTHPEVSAEIQGYTDSEGSAAINTKLSQKRADEVKNYLVNLGVDSYRISSTGFGPANPVADNSTTEGKQKNRRVIAVVK